MKALIILILLFNSLIVQGYHYDEYQINAPDSFSILIDSILVSDSSKEHLQITDTVPQTSDTNEKIIEKLNPPQLSDLISINKILWGLVLTIIGFFIIRFSTKALEILSEKKPAYRFLIMGFIPVIKIFGWLFIAFLIVVGVFRPPTATILAFSASIGVAIGFASQDILKNIFGGITIIFDRPFKVGDKIETGKYYGEVVEIGLRSTRIITPDDSLVTVPNGEIMNQAVSNSNSGEPNCQVVAEIFLPPHTDTKIVRNIANEAASVSKYIFLKKPVTILFFHEVHNHKTYLKMKVKAYVNDIRDEFKFKSDMTEIILWELIKRKMI